MGLASSLPVDFNEFAKYLEKERKRNWKQILCYAQNYAHVVTTGSAKDLLTLSSSRRKHAMEEPSSGPSRPVAELRKAQTIAAIRRMIVAGYSNSEIMEQLSISERTLYRRLAEAVDSDWQRLKEKDSSDELALQIGILEDRLNAAYRRLVAIATSPKTSARVKVEAECLAAHCAVAIPQVAVAGPLMIRRLTKELELDISHFGEPFDADEADIDSADRIKLAKRVVNRASEFW